MPMSNILLPDHVAGVAMFVQLLRQEAVLRVDSCSASKPKVLGDGGGGRKD